MSLLPRILCYLEPCFHPVLCNQEVTILLFFLFFYLTKDMCACACVFLHWFGCFVLFCFCSVGKLIACDWWRCPESFSLYPWHVPFPNAEPAHSTVCLEKLKTRSPRLHCLIRSHTSSMSTSDYTEAVSVTTTRDPCRHTSLASDQTDRLFSLLLIAVQAWLT